MEDWTEGIRLFPALAADATCIPLLSSPNWCRCWASVWLTACKGLPCMATSSPREWRQSSATEHSPSQVLWCGTVCQQTVRNSSTLSNLKSALKAHLFIWLYSRGCSNSYDVTAPLNQFYMLWRHRNHRCIIIIINPPQYGSRILLSEELYISFNSHIYR